MFEEKLRIAFEKSDEILSMVGEKDGQINTQRLIDEIEDQLNCRIKVMSSSFESINEKAKDYGAMMMTSTALNGRRIVDIVLNQDKDKEFQRFSLVHELGHLLTTDQALLFRDEMYTVSTHINYKITNIKAEDYEKSERLLQEQLANIFALRVLMPYETFYKNLNEYDSISKVAKLFGVTQDAVYSRIMLIK